jgi:hypothetical protein
MRLHGIVMQAELVEDPSDSDRVDMLLRIQGVGPGQPRRIVVPFERLVADPTLDPELVAGHAFQAEVSQVEPGRWVALAIAFGENRVLRPEPGS